VHVQDELCDLHAYTLYHHAVIAMR
jgi:hypothetical protein